jgi:HK97 family phage major capsid protein
MKLSLKLAKDEAEKREQVKAMLAKGDAATEAELKQADDWIGEIDGIQAQRKAAEQREAFAEGNESELEGLKSTPTNPLQHGDGNSGLAGFGAKAGDVTVDVKSQKIIEESGFALSEKQMGAIATKTYRDAFTNYLRKNGLDNLGAGDIKALAEGTDSAGGFLVPAQFLARMIERESAVPVLSNLVTQLQTSSDKLIMPKNTYSASDKYTTGVRVEWVDEETGTETEQNARNFGNVTIPIHTAMLYHDVTNNMLEDSAFDILGWLASKFRETSEVVQEDLTINGDGIGKPAGILLNAGGVNAPAVLNSGNANNYTADGLIDIAYSILARYKRNARFFFNSTSSGRAIAKLKDDNNRYLFSTGSQDDALATARPDKLLGYPIAENDFMADVAANALPLIFGDPKGYYKVQRVGFSIQILREIVATANRVRLLGRLRIGGQTVEDWRIKAMRIAA